MFLHHRNFSALWLISLAVTTYVFRRVGCIPVVRKVSSDDALTPTCVPYDDPFEDLNGVKIYALVYYGRRGYVDILNAYLERNLRKNGGILDGVIWAMVKYDIEDFNYLIMLHKRNPETYIIPWHMEGGDWDVIYRLADEPGAYYVKIDDDVVFIADGAIAEMVREKRRNRFLFVSANVVNHCILSAVHQELGAIPEMTMPEPEPAVREEGDGQAEEGPRSQKRGAWQHTGDVSIDPHYRIERTFYSDCVWRRWDCAALVHEAFLWRLENASTCAFDFGVFDFHSHGYGTMNDGLGRSIDWNINFFVFAHDDFADVDWNGIATDDEREFSSLHPMRQGKHAAALGRALVVHWSFSIQDKGLQANTTLLERYRALAETIMQDNAEKYYEGQWQPRGHLWER